MFKIGDMTEWAKVPLSWERVPSGALVRVVPDTKELRLGHAMRCGDLGRWVDATGHLGRPWQWADGDWGGLVEQIQIISLNMTGEEAAKDLLELMTGLIPNVEPLLQAWSMRHSQGRLPELRVSELDETFRPGRMQEHARSNLW